ncbi:hypothetical protein BCR42DRAFT_424456 [Absidia repens]|uniref:Homeodomain-like protein n=1 Tax=Absidia repens TaxID=90262 RepID=A0A1X2I4J3_9FUNG|nr:hypothetical protein BCR42DRAFT_424456 [Absidia repens]
MLSSVFFHRIAGIYGQCLISTRSSLQGTHQKLIPHSIRAPIHTTHTANNSQSINSSFSLTQRGTRSAGQAYSRRTWTKEEDELLKKLYKERGSAYTYISQFFINRSPAAIACRLKIVNPMNDTMKTGPWGKDELEALRRLTLNTPEEDIDWEKVQKQLPQPRLVRLIKQTWYHSINPKWNRGPWTEEETTKLQALVEKLGQQDWCKVSALLGSRSPRQCLEKHRYQVTPIHKGPFSTAENEAIMDAVRKHGSDDFMAIKKEMKSNRTPRQLSHHYRFILDPAYDRSPWSQEEMTELYNLTQIWGCNMTKIRELMNSRRHVKDMWNKYAKEAKQHQKSTPTATATVSNTGTATAATVN